MRELKIIFGWGIQIVGLLTIFLGAPMIYFVASFGKVLSETMYGVGSSANTIVPAILVLCVGVFLTWFGLRLRRGV